MNRAELVKALELIKPALAKDSIIPIFQNFAFDDERIFAFDNSIAILGPTDCKETFAVHGKTLLGILSNSTAEEVTVELGKDTATFKMGKTITDLPYNPKSDFIFELPNDAADEMIPFTVSMFEAFKLCLETVSTDETQRALQGITFDKNKIYSCDGDTVTSIQLKKGFSKPVMLPTAFCEAILNIWSTLNMTKGKIGYNEKWCVAEFEDWEVWANLPQLEKHIDFANEIKKTVKNKVELQPIPSGLAEALARARVLADPESQKTTISIGKNKIHMTTTTHMGDVDDFLLLKNHPDVHASISAAHLEKAIKYCDTFAIHENCIVLEKAPDIFMLISNM